MSVPHVERMISEKSDLDEKIGKLEAFVDGAIFKRLPDMEQYDLLRQFAVMNTYSEILGRRIQRVTSA